MRQQRSPRTPLYSVVLFVSDDSVGKGRVTNLSVSGCTIETAHPVERGAYLTLRFQLPGQGQPLESDLAAVRWVHGRQLGLEFIRLSSDTQARLRHLIDHKPGSTS